MNVLKIILNFLIIIFLLQSCPNSIKKDKVTPLQEEVKHFVERYCFDVGDCTNPVFVSGNKSANDYFEDECTLKNLKFTFIEDTVFIKPIAIEAITEEELFSHYSNLIFFLGNSILYKDYFNGCFDIRNFFETEKDKLVDSGHIIVLGQKYFVSIALEYDDLECIQADKLKIKSRKIAKQNYLIEISQGKFGISLALDKIDLADPNNYFFSRLIQSSREEG